MQVEEEQKEGPPAPVEEQTAPTEKDTAPAEEESSQTEEEEEEAQPRFHACMCLKFCRHSSMLALFICMFDIHACLLHA